MNFVTVLSRRGGFQSSNPRSHLEENEREIRRPPTPDDTLTQLADYFTPAYGLPDRNP